MQPYGSFEEKGYKFESFLPATDSDPVAFEVRIFIGRDLKHTLLVPMIHVPVFGVDIDDAHFLESIADRILKILPEPKDFNEATTLVLDKLENEIGGKAVKMRPDDSLRSGQFDYVGDLFAARFADQVGGREIMDQWMRTKLPRLGDRTPEEALRLDMAAEVLECIGEMIGRRLQGNPP